MSRVGHADEMKKEISNNSSVTHQNQIALLTEEVHSQLQLVILKNWLFELYTRSQTSWTVNKTLLFLYSW